MAESSSASKRKPSTRTTRPRAVPTVAPDDLSDPERARRVFRGVALPDVPSFSLESAADPEIVEEFTGIATLPGLTMLQLVTDGVSSGTLPAFFKTVLGEDQYERFADFADDPANGISMEVLIDLGTYLMAEYTGRPTKRSNAR